MQKKDDTENGIPETQASGKSFSILGLYVSITSWIIRIVGIVTILVFLFGLYNIFSGNIQAGLGVVLGCVVFAVLLGGSAVLFRLSEQLLEIKLFFKYHPELKS